MTWKLTNETLFEICTADAELGYKLTGFDGVIRVMIPPTAVDLVVVAGTITAARDPAGDARLTLALSDSVLETAALPVPP